MSYTLNIPDTLYAMLKEAADASGLTPVEWIASRLPYLSRVTPTSAPNPRQVRLRSLICWRAESAIFAVVVNGDYPSGAARNSLIIWKQNGGQAIYDPL